MVCRPISVVLKGRVMELLEEGWPVEEVGEIVLDVSVRTTHSPRWEDILTERGELKAHECNARSTENLGSRYYG